MSSHSQLVKTPVQEREVKFLAFGSNEEVKLTIAMVKNTLCRPTRSGAQPSDSDCIRFMMLCKARSLNPFEGDAYLVGYDAQNGPEFSLITSHQAFLKRAESCEAFDGIESGVIVQGKDGNIIEREGDFYLDGESILGAWCNVHRSDRKIPFKSRLRLQARKKRTAIWDNDTSGMIVKCAEADALRLAFPTKLGGMQIEQPREERDITPAASSSPLFQATTPALPAESPPDMNVWSQLSSLMQRDNIGWGQVCEVLAQNDIKITAPDVEDASEDDVKAAISGWDAIVKAVHGKGAAK